MTESAIRTSNLTRTFGKTIAVDRLNLDVRQGELFGLVGPDGAGKSTIMRLLSAILKPSDGEAWVGGYPVSSEGEAIKERIGYMSQRFGLYEDLTVLENLLFYADLYEVRRDERSGRIERLLGFSNLAPFSDRLAGNLSGGMKQKLGLACSLIHTPQILFLDEPTGGVDPISRRELWKILYDLIKEGATIFVSTAYLDEAERCTRVALIDRGRLLMTDKPGKIRKDFPLLVSEIMTAEPAQAQKTALKTAGIRNAITYGDRLHMTYAGEETADTVVEALRADGISVTGHRRILPSLEDVFISLIVSDDKAGENTR
jgi:ABC-2 type transport system ATP-binding protein